MMRLRPILVFLVILAPASLSQEQAAPAQETVPLPSVLDLDTAQRIALDSNPSIEAAEARIKQAKARVAQALSAYFPNISLSASGSKTWLSENDYRAARNAAFQGQLQQINRLAAAPATGEPLTDALQTAKYVVGPFQARADIDNSVDTYSASIAATWIIFNGFERKFTRAAARFGHKETEALYLEVQRQLLFGVASAFYNVQLQRENVRIAQTDVAFNQRQLKEAKARRRVGTGSLSQELNFEVRVRASQAVLLAAENSNRVALIGLAALMGIPDAAFPQDTQVAELATESPAELALPRDAAELISAALEDRPDVIQNKLAVERAKAAVGAKRAAFYPSIVASASRNAQTGDNKLGQDDFSATVGLSVSQTLFAGGRNRAGLVEAKAARLQAERERDSAEIEIASDVREAREDVLTAQQQLVLQRTNAEYVQRNRDLVEKEYNAGQTSLVRLNEAQRDLVQAKVRLASALVSLRQALYALETATAECLEPWRDSS